MMITRVTKVVNPQAAHPRLRRARPVANRRHRSANLAHALTLGFVNPTQEREVSMAKTRKRRASRPRHHASARRRSTSNPRRGHRRRSTMNVRRRRSRNPVMRRRSHNPTGSGVMKLVENTAAALVGLGTNNLAMTALSGTGITSNPTLAVFVSAAIAVASGYAVSKWDKEAGLFVGIGSMMGAGQLAINTWLPSVGSSIGLSGRGMGDFVGGRFAVPENPVLRGNPSAGGPAGGGALGGAYPAAYAIAA
jgi:hypothetical protein